MKGMTRVWLLLGVALLSALGADRQSDAMEAQGVVSYAITWYSIDGGGLMTSSGGGYTLAGTIGQPDAGVQSGGVYGLRGGFWAAFGTQYNGYLPLVTR